MKGESKARKDRQKHKKLELAWIKFEPGENSAQCHARSVRGLETWFLVLSNAVPVFVHDPLPSLFFHSLHVHVYVLHHVVQAVHSLGSCGS